MTLTDFDPADARAGGYMHSVLLLCAMSKPRKLGMQARSVEGWFEMSEDPELGSQSAFTDCLSRRCGLDQPATCHPPAVLDTTVIIPANQRMLTGSPMRTSLSSVVGFQFSVVEVAEKDLPLQAVVEFYKMTNVI